MSRSWNGEALVNELSSLLGDSAPSFKDRVLGWLNDIIFDIATRNDWGFHLVKGKKILSGNEEMHGLEVHSPEYPIIAVAMGGGLLPHTEYQVLVTFVQENGIETIAGNPSNSVSTDGSLLTINVEEIPTSLESLVVKRNVYLKKANYNFHLHTTIHDNFETRLTISKDTDSTIEPPDYESIRKLKGSPFFEGKNSSYLKYKDIDQLRLLADGNFSKGTPQYFSPIEENIISLYPIPSTDMEISFNYYRYPCRLYYSNSSQPDLPIHLKPVLKAGVVALGYEYRERAGQESKRATYEQLLANAIDKTGQVAEVEYSIRDVYGNISGSEVD